MAVWGGWYEGRKKGWWYTAKEANGGEFWWRRSDLSDATAGSKLDILPPESALFSTNYFYLWLHDGYGAVYIDRGVEWRVGGGGRAAYTRKRRVNAINTSALWMPAIIWAPTRWSASSVYMIWSFGQDASPYGNWSGSHVRSVIRLCQSNYFHLSPWCARVLLRKLPSRKNKTLILNTLAGTKSPHPKSSMKAFCCFAKIMRRIPLKGIVAAFRKIYRMHVCGHFLSITR